MTFHDPKDVEAIAKRWYTEQRGRLVGNTTFWENIPLGQKHHIIEEVDYVLEGMREAMRPQATPHEQRTKHGD